MPLNNFCPCFLRSPHSPFPLSCEALHCVIQQLRRCPSLQPTLLFLPSALKLMHMLKSRLNPKWQLFLPPIFKDVLQAVSSYVGDGVERAGLSSCFCLSDSLTSALWDASETIAHSIAFLSLRSAVLLFHCFHFLGHISVMHQSIK